MFPLSSPQRQSVVQTVYVLTVLVSFAFLVSSYSYAQSSVFLEAYAPAGTVSTPYNTTLTARGGTAPYTFSASGLPSGLTLNATTGLISGTPLTAGTSSVSATVSDANAEHAYLTFSILISKSGTVSVTVTPETASMLSGLTKQFSAKGF
jgi:hypothetical protein